MRSASPPSANRFCLALMVAALAAIMAFAAVRPVPPAAAESASPGTVAPPDTGAIDISSDQTLLVRGGRVFQRLLGVARRDEWEALPLGEVVARAGLELRGSPYEAGTLDKDPDRELCVVNLESFDCVTFVETTLAFARMWKSGGRSIRDFADEIERIRYREGMRDGYVSRLHYTTEWLADNGRRQIVRDIGGQVPGAEPLSRPIRFMSTHASSYRQLAAHPEWAILIAAREEALSADTVRYVPRGAIDEAAGELADGDIVCFTTAIPGLDISHLGLVARDAEGRPHLLHASTASGVILDRELSEYVRAMTRVTGVMAARPCEVE